MKKILGFVLVILVVGGVWYMTTRNADAPAAPVGGEQATSEVLSGNVSVAIKDYKFSPTPLKVKKGTKVTWTNEDVAKHTVTGDTGTWESKLLAQGETYSHTFDTVGTFPYHCAPHPYMKAAVEVVE